MTIAKYLKPVAETFVKRLERNMEFEDIAFVEIKKKEDMDAVLEPDRFRTKDGRGRKNETKQA